MAREKLISAKTEKRPRLMLLGARGQLGSDCREIFASDYEVCGFTSADLDLLHPEKIGQAVLHCRPQLIINAAAHTRVDACEHEPESARLINVESPTCLALAAKELGALLVQVSTDYVFAGDRRLPRGYGEEDPVGPVSVYGRSKLDGEKAVAGAGCDFLIVRTAWLYGRYGHNFLKTILRLVLSEPRRERQVVADQFGCLTWSWRLAQQLLELVGAGKRGLYHAVAEGSASWYEVACTFLDLMEVKHRLVPCSSDQYPTPARRPENSILLNRRLEQDGLLRMRPWRSDLKLFVARNRERLLAEALSS
ncbi:MAG: dTDP-4-dehydrorhamnose reductase [Deltaproteobacteria bacterium]|nr:dTDP-4-dehydrorhamnose reductase [Deltaproteobacteria bacterium]